MTERRLLVIGGRAGLALITAAAAAALAIGVVLVPGPTIGAAPEGIAVTPVRAAQTLACGGPVLGLSRGENPEIIAVGEPQRRSAGTGLVERSIADSVAVDGSAAVVELPAHAPSSRVAATERQTLDTPDLRGLAVAECLAPRPTAWLVGGDTTTGRTSLVVLSNPGAVAATVDLAVWGADGLIDATGTTGLIVPPGTQRIVPLSGIAPNEASPVVGVTSRGGTVAATLQQATVIGLEPAGVDIVTPYDTPAERLVIPGVSVIDGDRLAQEASALGATDLAPVLRLLAPGDEPAEISVRLVPERGDQSTSLTATIEAGAVVDISLAELADGEYSIIIESSAPVVASARAAVAARDGVDFAWFTASPELGDDDGEILVAVAPGAGALLHLVAPDGDASVTIDGTSVEIPAGTNVTVPLAGNIAVVLNVSGGVHASVSYRSNAGLAAARILPPVGAPRPITVYP